MEPLRGGRLASLSDEYAQELKNLRPEESIPAWAFRFLQSVPGVTMILSGMSNFEQLQENIHTFKDNKPLNEQELLLPAGYLRPHGGKNRAALHRLPLLRQSLSKGPGYPFSSCAV